MRTAEILVQLSLAIVKVMIDGGGKKGLSADEEYFLQKVEKSFFPAMLPIIDVMDQPVEKGIL